MQLSKSEEELMNILWEKQPAFMKDLIEAYSDPQPAVTTVATLLKRMTDKGFIGYNIVGRSRKYYAQVKKKDYFSRHVKRLIKNFFDDSTSQFASFFTRNTNLSKKELQDLRNLIDEELKKK
ncbi:MAG: BlaI/MecI/CopY family transcriptional regulator [Flavobacteriaceae bacterium]|nr:MAG: BlaI/MecI/CopY family transcriptional regulator [Flavobacteriaceae bacterium]